MELKNCIGIDIGYGFTKVYNEHGGKMFPTAVSEFIGTPTFSDLKVVGVNGRSYIVGYQAQREGGTIPTRTTGFVASDPWMAILSYALDMTRFGTGEIVLGVPPGFFSPSYRQEIMDALKKIHIRIGGTEADYTFNGNVHIIPQGAGIFFRHIKEHPEDFARDIVVIDVGHLTVDMTYFSEGKYVENAATSINAGLSGLLDRIIAAFNKQYRMDIRHKEALTILKEGSLNRMGTVFMLKERDSLAESYGKNLAALVIEYIDKLPMKPDMGIIGGGGGSFVKKFLDNTYQLTLIDQPEFANAAGYFMYGMQV